MKSKKFLVMGNWVLVVVLVVGILAVGCAPKPAPTPVGEHELYEVRAHTAVVGTSAYVLYAGMEEICKKHGSWLKLSSVEGAGGTANAHLLLSSSAEEREHLVMLLNPPDFLGVLYGLPPFENEQSNDLRVLHTLTITAGIFVTLDPNIKSIKDLEGKKVALGKATQTFWGALAAALLEDGFGLVDGENIELSWVGGSAGCDALKDGLVDAAFTGGYVGMGEPRIFAAVDELLQLSSLSDVYYLDLTAEAIEKMPEEGTVFPVRLPPGTLPGSQPNEVDTLGLCSTYCVDKSMPDEVAAEIVKMWMSHYAELADYHAIGTTVTPENFYYFPWIPDSELDNWVHPGALKAFREAGMER